MTPLPRTPSLRLDGRRALVVGASRGIGLGCAVALAEAGAGVVCASRGGTTLDEAVRAMREEGLQAEGLTLDIEDAVATEDAILDSGPFDVAVLSAGIARHRPLLETTPDDFDAVVRVNLRGVYFALKATARGMVAARKGGSIILVSSQMGHVGGPDRTVYAATKHAIEGLAKAAAIELAPHHVRVNTLGPTFVRTPLTEATFADPERASWINSKIKLGRPAEVEDLMGAVLFLAGDAAAMTTGSALLVDGGWTAG